jgi:hypothetical protein
LFYFAVVKWGVAAAFPGAKAEADASVHPPLLPGRCSGLFARVRRHGCTVLETSDGRGNMENLPDMTLRWTPGSAR